MLVLTRKVGERIRIGEQIELTVLRVSGGKVKLGFCGPAGIPIQRQEIFERMEAARASQPAESWNETLDAVPDTHAVGVK